MSKKKRSVNSITHEGDKRTNIPTAEYENMMRDEDMNIMRKGKLQLHLR